jgi:hypothetical protein
MDKLLGNDNIINATPAWNKSSLKRRNQVAKERSNAGHNGFSNNLIDRVAKANGPKLTKGFRTRALGDQRDKSPVKIMGHFATVENMRHFFHNRITHNVPTLLKKPRVKPIRARGLKRLKGPEARLNFLNRQGNI